MRRAASLLIILAGCQASSPRHGTIVGNPGDAMVRAAPGEGVEITAATVFFQDLEFTDCDQKRSVSLGQEEELDLLEGSPVALEPGTWCALDMHVAGELYVQGTINEPSNGSVVGTAPTDFFMQLYFGMAFIEQGMFEIDERSMYVLEIGQPGWLDATEMQVLGVEYSQSSTLWIDEGHPLHTLLEERVMFGSSLFKDVDGDGEISNKERQQDPR